MSNVRWPSRAGWTAILSMVACGPSVTGPEPPVVTPPPVAGPGAVLVPARPGAVQGSPQSSDEFLWRRVAELAAPFYPDRRSPVVFETWASDADTFSLTPRWPPPEAPKKLRSSVLLASKTHGSTPIDAPCKPPGNAAVGGFPTGGTPAPCIAEETKRNRPQFDYIVANQLNTQEGLSEAYRKALDVQMPTSSLSVKGDWVPIVTLLRWIPGLGDAERVRQLYYTNTAEGVEYALVSMHLSSRQNPNWVWGTLEHEMNPGRCDDLGCWDTFGAQVAAVRPDRRAINTQYGPCAKTPAWEAMASQAKLSRVWAHYCMKSTMVDYVSADGTPYALGNSVIERIVGNGTVAASSCIACHVYASFGVDGKVTDAASAMLPYNPTGQPIPAVLQGALKFDFMWGVLLAPSRKASGQQR